MLQRVNHRHEIEAALDLFKPSSVKIFKFLHRGEFDGMFVIEFRPGEIPSWEAFSKGGKERPIAAADIQGMARIWESRSRGQFAYKS